MNSWFLLVFRALTGMARSSASLATENAVLRHQLAVLLGERPRPPLRPASTTWSTFLASHASELWTMDLTTQPMWDHSVRYLLVLMELQSRGGVPEPLHPFVGRPPSSHRHGLHRLLQSGPTSSGDRRDPRVRTGKPEGDPSGKGGGPDQDHSTSRARQPSPRLPTRRVAQVCSPTLGWPQSGLVVPGHAPQPGPALPGPRCPSRAPLDPEGIRSWNIRPAVSDTKSPDNLGGWIFRRARGGARQEPESPTRLKSHVGQGIPQNGPGWTRTTDLLTLIRVAFHPPSQSILLKKPHKH